MVRVWARYDTEAPVELAAWRAVTKMRGPREGVGSGLVLDWCQHDGHLFAGGEVQHVHVWDAAAAVRVARLPTEVPSCLTAMGLDAHEPGLLVAGFGNGSVCLFDKRLPPAQAVVHTFEQHTSWVVATALRGHHVVSGSKAGDVLWWDRRFAGQAVRNLAAYKLKKDDTMNAMAVHPAASLLATASPNQFVKIFNLEGELLSQHKHYTNFLGDSIGPISALAFHPLLPRLAAVSYENIVTIYAPPARRV